MKAKSLSVAFEDTVLPVLEGTSTAFTLHHKKLAEAGKGEKDFTLTDTQTRMVQAKIRASMALAGIKDPEGVLQKNIFHTAMFKAGQVVGTPLGVVDGLLTVIPGYTSFRAGMEYGHANGFALEQKAEAWATVKVKSLADRLPAMPWRKAPELNNAPSATSPSKVEQSLKGALV